MKNNKLFLKIYISVLSLYIIALIILCILGNKTRIGYLSEFNLDIGKTLEMHDLEYMNANFIVYYNLTNKSSIENYIFTNELITNYYYQFRIKYYDKIFRNSDIYEVYPNLINIPENYLYVKNINMNSKGVPFGNIKSDKKIDYDEKYDIDYNLKIKKSLYIILIILLMLPLILKLIPIALKIINFIEKKSDSIFYKENYQTKPNILLLIIFMASLTFLLYNTIFSSYYYYYAYDSSAIYGKDILLLHMNMMPEHFVYPNMTPLLMFKYIFLPLGSFFGIIPNISFEDFKNSLNPYFIYADITQYSLTIFRISFLLFLTFMVLNIIKLVNKFIKINNNIIYYYIIILIFINTVFLGTKTPVFIHLLNVIRYETIGLLLSSIALYFIRSLSDMADYSFNKKHIVYILISGILIGFTILSKMTLAGWSVIIFITYIILNLDKLYYLKDIDNNLNTKLKRLSIFLFIFLVILIIFNIIMYNEFVKKNIQDTAFLYNTDPKKLLYMQTLVPIFFSLLTVVTILVSLNKIKLSNIMKLILYIFIIYSISVFSAILFSLFLPNPWDTLLNTYIFSYGGGIILAFINSEYGYGDATKNALKYLLIIFVSSSIIIALYFCILKNVKKIFSTKIIKISLSILLVILSFIFMNTIRKYGTDLLISIYTINFSVLLFYLNLLSFEKYKNVLIIILIVILSIFSFTTVTFYVNKINGTPSYSSLAYNLDLWIRDIHSYGTKRGSFFKNTMENVYYNNTNLYNSTFYWSKDIQKIKNLLLQTDYRINDTIIAVEGFSLLKNSDMYISKIDNEISGGLLIKLTNDNNNIYLRDDYDFYFISDVEYKKNDPRVVFSNYDFYVNDKKYFVYKLNINLWRKSRYEYIGNFTFVKGTDFNEGFILISDRLAKGL